MEKEQPAEDVLDRVERKAGDYEELWENCAQGTLLALQEEFQIGNEQTLKMATSMPGVASRGETCGAVIGALMALALEFGREKAEDSQAVGITTSRSRKLCKRFEDEFGSCNCRDVQHRLFGRSFDFYNPEDQAAIESAGMGKKCRIPAGRAARLAAEIILKSRKKMAEP